MDGYTIYGAEGSPYSVKMRAVMRAKRLPYRWAHPRSVENLFQHVKVPVIPVVRFPDGSWRNDSTPMIAALEAAHPEPALVPADEADAFVAWLLEDFADEWGTKIMFHERWAYPADRDVQALSLMLNGDVAAPLEAAKRMADAFRDRQVGRMALVGCTPENAPVIEASREAVYAALAQAAQAGPWLFGPRPSVADLGWYGQLWQLLRDPTPRTRMRETHPRVFAWLELTDDASAAEGDWRPAGEAALTLARLAGDLYLPFLAANAQALAEGREGVELELLGRPYFQAPFKYQARCLADLSARYAALSPAARATVDAAVGPGAAHLAG